MHIIPLAAALALLALPAAAQDYSNQRGDYGAQWQGGGNARQINAVMLRRSWLYAGPARNFPRAGIVYPQGRVRIMGCLRGYGWCDIFSRGSRGWVRGSDLAVLYGGRRQGIGPLAPTLGIGVQGFEIERYWEDHYRRQPFYRERDRWQRQYVQNFDPSWGPGPNAAYYDDRERDRQQAREDRREERMEYRRDEQQRMDDMQRRDPPRPYASSMTDTGAAADGQRFDPGPQLNLIQTEIQTMPPG